MSSLKVKTINQLESWSGDEKWLIDGLWLKEGRGILAAVPKTGKTWLALDVAISLASGVKCLNQFMPVRPAKVLFCNAEDPEKVQNERLRLVSNAKGFDVSNPNLGVICLDKNKIRLDIQSELETLRTTVKDFKPELLILDPFVRLHSGINENNVAKVAALLDHLTLIQKEFRTAVLLVHHAGKSGQKIRGSGEFHAWGDSNLYMSKDPKGQINLSIEHRAAESSPKVPLILKSSQDKVCFEVYRKDEETILLEEHLEQKIVNEMSLAYTVSVRYLIEKTNMDAGKAYSAIERLETKGLVRKVKRGYVLTSGG